MCNNNGMILAILLYHEFGIIRTYIYEKYTKNPQFKLMSHSLLSTRPSLHRPPTFDRTTISRMYDPGRAMIRRCNLHRITITKKKPTTTTILKIGSGAIRNCQGRISIYAKLHIFLPICNQSSCNSIHDRNPLLDTVIIIKSQNTE